MSTDLKADLLEALPDAMAHMKGIGRHGCAEHLGTLLERLKPATITEPPPPDPCVVECEGMNTSRSMERDDYIVIHDDEHDAVRISRTEAAALIPALQAFVREGGA